MVPRGNDVVFAREGSVGASVIVPEGLKCCLGQRVMLFRLMAGVLPSYFSLALSEVSSLARLLTLHKCIGARHVNVADMRNDLIPLPPLAEQHRIVTKVDELMAVCDQLVAQLTTAQTERRRLLEAVLHDALAPDAALIASLMADGQSRAEATAHAEKILGERDRFRIDENGTEHEDDHGPML
jgi:type I restriction enzyme, S subunit